MSGYIGTQPVPQATQTRDVFTATSGQTTFATAGYTPNFVDVYLNGVKLVDGDDFTATNGSEVVLTTGATAGDTVEVLAYTAFSPANVYTIAEADAAFATAAQGVLADSAVQPNDNVTLGVVTATSFSGDGSGLTGIASGAGSTEAWVNFNGTGTVAIRASGNVSSITDTGVGNYSVNFLNSMPSVYYSAPRVPDYDGATGTGLVVTSEVLSATASSIRVTSSAPNGTLYDCVRFDMTVTA